MPLLKDVVIGLDASTTACKAIAWDTHGRPLAEGRAPLALITPGPDLFEQDADTWWQATCLALQEVTQHIPAGRLAGLAVSHQRESFVLVDSKGVPLSNAILWMDERSRLYLDGLGKRLGLKNYHLRTGKPLSGNLAPGKLAWLRDRQPAVLERASRLLDTHAFLIHRLTGAWKTSSASADPLGLYDMLNGRWDAACLEILELDPTFFPEVKPPGDFVGEVNSIAAKESGLPMGLPVFAGLGDGQAAALGCGISQPGFSSLSLGTSVISGTFAPAYTTHSAFRTMTAGLPGSFVLETVLLGGAYTLQWFSAQFLAGQVEPAVMESKSALLPPGAQGLLLVPYWNTAMGPYWDPSASGIVVGWRGIHRPEHFYRAILEGIGFELRLQLEQVAQVQNTPLVQLVASGGGAKSSLWLQILSDQLGIPVERSTAQESASLGAAMLAAAGAGLFPDIASAVSDMRPTPGTLFSTHANNHRLYTDLYEKVYRGLYPGLQSALRNLSDLTAQTRSG